VNGAEALMRAVAAAGVEVCFTNPGTTEMHLVGALDAVPRVRAILGLFEGVCTGAADGYGRMTERPALTLLHLGPGLANGVANLHNARRAATPIVNLVGDHPTWHVANDPPLASDIEGLARTCSKWTRTSKTSQNLAFDAVEAISAALSPPGGVSTLVVPADCAWETAADVLPRLSIEPPEPVSDASLEEVVRALGHGPRTVLLLGGAALREPGLTLAARIAAATGCRLLADTFVARMERGAGRPRVDRLPYFPEQLAESLRETTHLIVAGTREPVAFFGYPRSSARPVPDSCRVVELGGPGHDLVPALEELAQRLARDVAAPVEHGTRPELPSGPLTPASLGAAIAALQPAGAILVDEGATSSMPYWLQTSGVPPFTYLGLTGGAIGQGLPCATGAAIACPDRPVIAFQADGSALYTAQALWTQAREGLDVTTVICANREYRILRIELGRADITRPGPQAESLTSLRNPEIDWVELSRGFGVPAARAENADTLVSKLRRALAEPGPHLIEAIF
jgi:acetolactate synthase I/II/III large subunit